MDNGTVRIQCQQCGARFRVLPSLKEFTCPKCRARLAVSARVVQATASLDISCEQPSARNREPLARAEPSETTRRSYDSRSFAGQPNGTPTETPGRDALLAATVKAIYRGMRHPWLRGLLYGLLLFPVFTLYQSSLLKGLIILAVIAAVACLLAMVLLWLAGRWRATATMSASTETRGNAPDTAHAHSRPRSRLAGLATSLAIMVGVCGALFGLKGQGVFDIWPDNQDPTPALSAGLAPLENLASIREPVGQFDEKPWIAADFVIVNPSHVAVALARNATQLRVLAKAVDDDAVRAMKTAWIASVQIRGNDPALARQVLARSDVGALVDAELCKQIERSWRAYSFIPGDCHLMLFNDLRSRKRRIGHIPKADDPVRLAQTEFTFLDLIPTRLDSKIPAHLEGDKLPVNAFKSERIAKELIQPGTQKIDLTESELRDSADFLDVCLYEVLRKLESKEPRFLHLHVDRVSVRTEELMRLLTDEEKRIVDKAQEELSRAAQPTKLSEEVTRKVLTPPSKSKADRSAKRSAEEDARLAHLREQLHRLRELEDHAGRLTGEIRSRLAKAGMPMAEGARQAIVVDSAKEANKSQPLPFEKSFEERLIGCSHVLYTDIRSPESRGRYQLSMRLVEIPSGTILWEDLGDRADSSPHALEVVDSPYLLSTGQLVLLTFQGEKRPELSGPEESLLGGFPLNLPLFTWENTPKTTKPAAPAFTHPHQAATRRSRQPFSPAMSPPEGLYTRLGYEESSGAPAGRDVAFRELFSTDRPQLVASSLVRKIPVSSLVEIPEAHAMRYVLWRLAKVILPLAGRVVAIESRGRKSLDLTLSRKDGVKAGDRLVVIRPAGFVPQGAANQKKVREEEPEHSDSDAILPVELTVTQVHDRGAKAIYERDAAQADDMAAQVQPGMVVHGKLPRKVTVAILPPKVDLSNLPAEFLNGRSGKQEAQEMMNHVGKRLIALVQSGLLELKVSLVEREEIEKLVEERDLRDIDLEKAVSIGRLTGASHLILGTVSPSPEFNFRAPVSLRVVEVESGRIVDRLEFRFSVAQMEHWKP